ncbi:MAG: electron transport complex subunit RsxA, partial [Candidatus Omnitrophica bacterium]|nr:electron transport complex subunit RsxA [Candidatus Omnitrophota bacterium]
MDISKFIVVIISMVFVNNFILSKFLGLCPFIGVSKNIQPAMSMGMAVTFVAGMSSAITWLIYA